MRTLSLIAFLLTGCPNGLPNTDDTDTDTDIVTDGCPSGLSKPSQAQVFFGLFQMDGIGTSVYFDADLKHNGQPTACISDNSVQMLIHMGDDPFAWISFTPESPGTYSVGGTGVFTVFDVIGGTDSTLFANSDFSGGTWSIFDSTDAQSGQVVNAYAVNNEHSISFSMDYDFKP